MSTVPHRGQVREVFLGSTKATGTPAASDLHSMNDRNWANPPENCRLLWPRRTVVRWEMHGSSSWAISRPVSLAVEMRLLEIEGSSCRARVGLLRVEAPVRDQEDDRTGDVVEGSLEERSTEGGIEVRDDGADRDRVPTSHERGGAGSA